MEFLEESDTRTKCPFKGQARYFHLNVGGGRIENAAWRYENPYAEHPRALKDRIAFHDEKPEIAINQTGY